MKTKALIVGILLTATAMTGVAIAKSDGMKGHGHMRAVFKQLDLTEEQREQAKEIMQLHKSDMESNKAQHKAFKSAVKNLIDSGQLSQEAFSTLWKDNQEMFEQAAYQRAKLKSDMHTVLNEEQIQKLDSIMEKKRSKRDKQKSRSETTD